MSVSEMKRMLEDEGHVLLKKWESIYFFSIVQEEMMEPEFVLFELPLKVNIEKAPENLQIKV
jgi:hypothetical protein